MQRLTTTDAFFIAYQERSGILMHLGAEVELAGALERPTLEAALARVVARWPALACTAVRRVGGLAWRAGTHAKLVEGGDLAAWRDTPIDPFREAPFGVLWQRRAPTDHVLAFRCHHAVADGQLFLAIVAEVLAALTDGDGRDARDPDDPPHPLAFGRLWGETRLGASWRYTRWLTREAAADRSARVALRELAPGGVGTCDRRLGDAPRTALVERAARERVRPPWLVAAAWIHALHAYGERRGAGDNPLVSLEIPVSLRRGPHAMTGTGNHLTVLTLFGDARAPLGELARTLWDDYVAAIKRRDHLAVPLFAAPARLLPWPVFKRVAVTTTSTGFATSHFTWFEPDARMAAARSPAASPALTVRDAKFYTPVCLRMGAALGVIAWPGELQLAITHRLTGMTAADAGELADLLVEKLA